MTDKRQQESISRVVQAGSTIFILPRFLADHFWKQTSSVPNLSQKLRKVLSPQLMSAPGFNV